MWKSEVLLKSPASGSLLECVALIFWKRNGFNNGVVLMYYMIIACYLFYSIIKIYDLKLNELQSPLDRSFDI